MITRQLTGKEEFDFNDVTTGMAIVCEDRSWLSDIATVLEHLGIKITSYEGTSDTIIKFEKITKTNKASDKELKAFASFIADGMDMASLMENYEFDIVKKLECLSDEQLIVEKEFYGYKD